MPLTKKALWKCNHCEKSFVNETPFLKHSCPQMRRNAELATPIGQQAYACYNAWMKAKGFAAQKPEAFAASSQFASFIRFAEWARLIRLPDVDAYIKAVTAENWMPATWRVSGRYTAYMKNYDTLVPPMEQFDRSIVTLKHLAEHYEVPLGEVFEATDLEELMIRAGKRQLSRWCLFTSDVFTTFLKKLPYEQKEAFAQILDVNRWPDDVRTQSALINTLRARAKCQGI
jgi:hypothetical protein